MNEEYYEQNSCYDSNSFGFDQFQLPQYTVNHPIFNAQNEFLNSQNKLMEQMTSICDMVGQIMQKKEEERRIVEEQAAKEDMSIEEMRHEQQLVYYKIKEIMNDLGYKRFHGEKIDEGYKRDDSSNYSTEDIQGIDEYNSLKDVRNISDVFSELLIVQAGHRPLFYFDNDDDEYTVIWRRPKAITPDEPIEEPDNSLSMGDEHLDTISDVEILVPIPSEFEGISDDTCDEPVCDDSSTFDALNDNSEILSNSNNDDTSSDDDDFEDVEYVSLEEVNDDHDEKEFDLEDILQIQDVILREKLLNVHRLITNIESLNNNPTPDFVFKSPSPFPIPVADSDSFLEESDTSLSHLDNSLPEFESFSDHTEETRSGSTTTHANYSLPEYDSFLFEIEPDQEGLISIDNSNNTLLELPEFESFHFDPSFPRPPPEPPDVEICLYFEPDAPVIDNFNELNDGPNGK
ncbi:hypothetical protein Tco_0449673 [Tanacetum coccineum]